MHSPVIMEEGECLIEASILDTIIDKNEQKRRFGRNNLLHMLSGHIHREEHHVVGRVVLFFQQRYVRSADYNRKLVGLEVMAHIVLALEPYPELLECHLPPIVASVLRGFSDSEPKIRCAAIKAMYEVFKTLREGVLGVLTPIFEQMMGCICDCEDAVRQSCLLLDGQLKDVLFRAEEQWSRPQWDAFVAVLKRKLKTMNLDVRRFLLGWVRNLLELNHFLYLPHFLEELLAMVADRDIEGEVAECLGAFEANLKEKFQEGSLEGEVGPGFVEEVVGILIRATRGKNPPLCKLQAIEWLKMVFMFVREEQGRGKGGLFGRVVIRRFDEILEPILLLMSNEEEEVRGESVRANELLLEAIGRVERQQPINFSSIVPILKEVLSEKKMTKTSQYAMGWLRFMLKDHHELPELKQIIQKVVEKMPDSASPTIAEVIELLKLRPQYFAFMVERVLAFLHDRPQATDAKAEPMIRKFISSQDSQRFLGLVCAHAQGYADCPAFMKELALAVNNIVVNEPLLIGVRQALSDWRSEGYLPLFGQLYRTLRFSVAAVVSLCLLGHQYQLAGRILLTLTDHPQLPPPLLIDLTKLVTQLEQPAFTFVRVELLAHDEQLHGCLNCLLMLLPQGRIFNMLRNRLEASYLACRSAQSPSPRPPPNPVDLDLFFGEYQEWRRPAG